MYTLGNYTIDLVSLKYWVQTTTSGNVHDRWLAFITLQNICEQLDKKRKMTDLHIKVWNRQVKILKRMGWK